MKEILQLFWSFLVSNGFPQPALLEKGLSREYIISQLKPLDSPPEELIEWYQWQNGYPWGGKKMQETFLINYGYAAPLEDAIKYKKSMEENDSFMRILCKDMLPIFYSGAGEMYFYNLETTAKYKIYLEEDGLSTPEPVPAFKSLEQLLRTAYEGFKRGIYKFEDGRLRWDYEQQRQLFIELNPEINYWRNGYSSDSSDLRLIHF
jgi:hypothetical protein